MIRPSTKTKRPGRNTRCPNCNISNWSLIEVEQTTSSDVNNWESAHNESIPIDYDDRFMFA